MSSCNSPCPNCGGPVQTVDGTVLEANCPWCSHSFYDDDEGGEEGKMEKDLAPALSPRTKTKKRQSAKRRLRKHRY